MYAAIAFILSSSQPQLMFQTTPLNLFVEHLKMPMACLYNACLMPQTDGFNTVCLATAPKRAKHAKESQVKNSTTSQTKTQEVGKSLESSLSDCNFQDFENFESLNRNHSSFAKQQIQNCCCNLLIKFHTSNQGMSATKNIPKEHLQWVKQMAKHSAVIDSLLMYRDEFMEDPNRYRILVPNEINFSVT